MEYNSLLWNNGEQGEREVTVNVDVSRPLCELDAFDATTSRNFESRGCCCSVVVGVTPEIRVLNSELNASIDSFTDEGARPAEASRCGGVRAEGGPVEEEEFRVIGAGDRSPGIPRRCGRRCRSGDTRTGARGIHR